MLAQLLLLLAASLVAQLTLAPPCRRPGRTSVAEARRRAPRAPAFRPGLERPKPTRMEELKDVMLVKKDSSFDDAAQWINQGGRAIVVDRWRDFEMCRKTLLKPLRQKPASAKDAEPGRDN